MIKLLLAAASLSVAPQVAMAQTLPPTHAETIDLGTTRGSVFYTAQPDGYHVVATLQSGRQGDPIRFNTVLADGQRASVSIPGPSGTLPHEVTFARSADRLDVRYAIENLSMPTQ